MKTNILSILIALGFLFLTATTLSAQYAETPNMGFQSTSTMAGTGSAYSSNPMLNADGTAALHGPSRISGARYTPPGTTGDKDGPGLPIGDEMVPLLIFALGYGIYRIIRKQSIHQRTNSLRS